MESLQYFAPNLSGPATNQTSSSADNEQAQADDVDDHLGVVDLKPNAGIPGVAEQQMQ